MKLKRLITMLLTLAMVFSLAACSNDNAGNNGNSNVADGNTSTENAGAKPVHLNLPESWGFESFYPIITPANSSSGYGITYYLTSFYDTLVQYDESDNLVGALAESWSVSNDGKVYTFNLRQGIKFSDGSDFTADDVAKSLLAVPVGLGQYNGGYGKLSTIISDAVIVDEHTVELHLSQPYYSTLRDLCLPNPFAIVSSEQFNDDLTVKESFNTATYGTGPYMYEGDGDSQTYNFVKNPNYWGNEPDVDSFSIKVIPDNDAKILALRNGELDYISGITKITAESYMQISSTNGFGAKTDTAAMQTYYMGYNLADPIFSDAAVRNAISHAIDKESIVNSIFDGLYQEAESLFTSSLPYCDVTQTVYDFDMAKANELLDAAGYTDTDGDGIREKDGVKITANFVYQTGSVADDDLVVYICDQLKKIGIELTPKSAAMMDWYGMIVAGEYGVTVFKTQGGYYDPANVVSAMNPAMSMDPIVMQIGEFLPGGADLINELDSSTDENRIGAIYTTVLTTIADNSLVTPIYYTHQLTLYNDKVADYIFPGDASFTSIQNIKLK